MFCPKCGTNNEDGARFCAACGAEVVDNQSKKGFTSLPVSVDMDKVIRVGRRIPAGINTLPKSVKRLSLMIIGLTAIVVALIITGSVFTNPINIAKGFFEARANGDWEKMFGYLSLDSSEFINVNSFSKYMERERNPEVISFDIKEIPTERSSGKSSESTFTKIYVVEYLLKGVPSVQTETITLVKKIGKKFFLFDDYRANIDFVMTVSDYKLSVPSGSIVYIDDIRLTKKSSSTQDIDTYVVSEIFYGEYNFKIEHSEYGTYTAQLPLYGQRENSYSIYDFTNAGLPAPSAPPVVSAAPPPVSSSAPAASAPTSIAPASSSESASSSAPPAPPYDFSKENVINDTSNILLEYYLSYLTAINEQDASYLTYTTQEQAARLEDKIFGVNKEDIFTFDQIIMDLDTVELYSSNSQMHVSFYAAFQFGYEPREGNGSLQHGANIQLIRMVYDESYQEWLVDSGEVVQGITIGSNQLVLR